MLNDYIKERAQAGLDKGIQFENLDRNELNSLLSRFYMDARTVKGEFYKVSSLENFRHSLNRYLQSLEKKIDIIKDPDFSEANMAYKAALVELKKAGKGTIERYPLICESDREKLYSSELMNPTTPKGLSNKVQFDIRLYFSRRGSENITSMTKHTFCIKTDPDTRMQYVCKREDELTKNHRENDNELISGFMPEAPGHNLCPVSSFKKFIDKLNRRCDRLWQKPRQIVKDDSKWFCNVPLGKNTLSGFMEK